MKLCYEKIAQLHDLTASEMSLFLYMVTVQDQRTGTVEGLYYRDALEATGMCRQSFYNALYGLVKKRVIEAEKKSDVDYDIRIPGNAFPDGDYSRGYVKLNREVFHKKAFHELKSHEKYLMFDFLKGTHENGHSLCIGVGKFYEKYEKLLGVSRRVIRTYLHRLKRFFSIGIKNGNYYITYLHSVFRKDSHFPGYMTEREHLHGQLVRKECNRQRISYTPSALHDTLDLVAQAKCWVDSEEERIGLVMWAVRQSVEGVPRKLRRLSPAYVHKLLDEAVQRMFEKNTE